jgi:hypothetical protein
MSDPSKPRKRKESSKNPKTGKEAKWHRADQPTSETHKGWHAGKEYGDRVEQKKAWAERLFHTIHLPSS